MAKVIVDYIPPIKDEVEEVADVKESINISFNKANEILRLLSIGINTIEFGDGTTPENVYCSYENVEFETAGTELDVEHGLGKVPTSIIGKKLDKPGEIYFSQAATSTNLYLKSDTDSLSGTIVIT